MKAIIFARVSTEEQKDAGNSLPAQVRRMEEYCKRKGFTIVETFSFDESAYKEKRDEFDKIIEYLDGAKEKLVVCCDKVDRLSRNVFDKRVSTLYNKALVDKIELHFVSDGQVINSNMSATDKFQFGINLGLAKYYSDAISDNVRRSFEQKRLRGEITSQCVIGYKFIDVGGDKKDLVPDPERAHLIVKIFEMYASGQHSMETIKQEVTRLGLRSRGGNVLSKSTIERILGETFYHGFANSKKNGQTFPHKYEKLISKDLFDKCKMIRQKRKKVPSKTLSKDFVFKGLLTCAQCGCTITPEHHQKKSGLEYRLYSCTNSKKNCKRVYVNENLLLEPINSILDAFASITEETQNTLVEELRETSEAELRFHKAQIARIQTDHTQLTNRKQRLLNLLLDESITKEDYDKTMQEINDRIQLLGIELNRHSQADHDYKTTVATVLSVARRAKDIFESSETHEKRQFVDYLIQNPILEGKKMVFTLQEPFNYVLNLAEEQQKTISISTDRPSWLGGRGSNPRPSR